MVLLGSGGSLSSNEEKGTSGSWLVKARGAGTQALGATSCCGAERLALVSASSTKQLLGASPPHPAPRWGCLLVYHTRVREWGAAALGMKGPVAESSRQAQNRFCGNTKGGPVFLKREH